MSRLNMIIRFHAGTLMVAVESCASAVAADTRSIINENHLAMINGAICKLVLK